MILRDKKGRFVKGTVPVAGFKKGHIPWMSGKKHTTESKSKMSIAKKGKHFSPETEFKKGHIKSEEWRKKVSIANTGKTQTDSAKLKISIANSGSKNGMYGRCWNKHPRFISGYGSYKRYFIRNGGKPVCEQCGKEGRFAINSIHIHHKDGNRHNNELDNIQALCSSCHLHIHKNWEKVKR